MKNDTSLHYFADHLPDTGIQFCHAGIDDKLGVFRDFIRRRDAGEIGDLSGANTRLNNALVAPQIICHTEQGRCPVY